MVDLSVNLFLGVLSLWSLFLTSVMVVLEISALRTLGCHLFYVVFIIYLS